MVAMWGLVTNFGFFTILLILVRFSKKKSKMHDFQKYVHIWTRRLEYLLSYKPGKAVILQVANEFADFFNDIELDWAPTDIAVGLILLKREQKKIPIIFDSQIPSEYKLKHKRNRIKDFLRDQSLGAARDQDPNLDAKHADNVLNSNLNKEVKRSKSNKTKGSFDARFKLGPRVLSNPISINIDSKSNSLQSPSKNLAQSPTEQKNVGSARSIAFPSENPAHEPITKEDIWDILHFAHYAEMAYVDFPMTNKELELVVEVSKNNDLFYAPFIVSLDHDWKAIVVSIRGTYSIVDILVDLKIDLVVLDEERGFMAHSGMFETAKNIFNQLDKGLILKKHLEVYSGYNIVVTGHSLGAGVGALLSFLLRKADLDARCYAYAPPGGLLNLEAAAWFTPFCVSVVSGHDFIPRLSRYSMDLLKYDLKHLLDNCKLPKYKILGSLVTGKMKNDKIEQGTVMFDHKPISSALRVFMPGRILYIEKIPKKINIPSKEMPTKSKRARLRGNDSLNSIKNKISHGISKVKQRVNGKYVYIPRWADRQEFERIVVSRSMISDHLAFTLLQSFQDAPLSTPLRSE